ncbi:MAG: hypothetical protein ABGZ49_03195 [Akkermansiaceae bacterium]
MGLTCPGISWRGFSTSSRRHDPTSLTWNAGADSASNELDDLIDYALGHAPGAHDGIPVLTLENGILVLSYARSLAADDFSVFPSGPPLSSTGNQSARASRCSLNLRSPADAKPWSMPPVPRPSRSETESSAVCNSSNDR